MNSLRDFQNQFGRNICYVIAVLIILFSFPFYPVGILGTVFGVLMIIFISKYYKELKNGN